METHLKRRIFLEPLLARLRLPGVVMLTMVCCLLAEKAPAVPAADGLYATFETTEGEFVIQLEFEKVPTTVANFVGLAAGTRAWVDFQTGHATTEPFYDGLRIPRAEPGFVIQMGSPTNTTSGGPGYAFNDEIHPDLRHDAAGVVSMANSGADSNGSQFFITLDANSATHLDNKHAVFGSIVEGLDVVTAIGDLTPGTVTIQSVTIHRNGAAAQAFDETAWGLPVITQAPVEFDDTNAPASYFLTYSPKPFGVYQTFNSPNLADWDTSTIFFLDDVLSSQIDVTDRAGGEIRQFFRVTEAQYVPVPASVNGRTIVFTVTSADPDQTLTMTFTGNPRGRIDYANSLGTFTLTTPGSPDVTGRIGAYVFTQELIRGVLGINLENVGTFFFNQKYQPDGSGYFTIYVPDEDPETNEEDGPFGLYGTFTSGPTAP